MGLLPRSAERLITEIAHSRHACGIRPRAAGLMEIEHLIRYAPLAVGVNPSAMECEARLRGLLPSG